MLLLVFFAGCSDNEIEQTEETQMQVTNRLASVRCESNDGELLTESFLYYGETGSIERVEIIEYYNNAFDQKTVLTYNVQGYLQEKIVSYADIEGYERTNLTYDEQGHLIRTHGNHLGNEYHGYTDYYYNENGMISFEKSFIANTEEMYMNEYSTYQYNEQGQLNGKNRNIEMGTYHYVLTEYTYDSNGLLLEEKSECFEELLMDSIGYMQTTYSYDAEGRIAQKSYIESIYGGYGGTWDTEYDYTYKNIQLSNVSGTETYTDVAMLHDLSGETFLSIKMAPEPTIVRENGDVLRIDGKDKQLIFVYEEEMDPAVN